ncbi:hypothetical protein OEG84_21505 [Hoeflea sp. G2-23]|uniref:Uncharacterized protein n=1 Tax=Hoeflea algicola TaxID=2983763 RepID=A0ABT3ZEH9_9HYPH|nr:hypothetical protein [Hoeflea algicola]MCY0150210.1 hypothetical protein [Hoeflea algicola]
MMTKRHKRKPELTSSQIDDLVARTTALHKDLIPLLCDLKPQGQHYNAVVDLSDALARTIRNVSGDEPKWMQPRISR